MEFLVSTCAKAERVVMRMYLQSGKTFDAHDSISFFIVSLLTAYCAGVYDGEDLHSDRLATKQPPKASSCFIATAAMGGYLNPEVNELRLFRDQSLLSGPWKFIGTPLVSCYYKISPPIADVISKNSLCRVLVRTLLIKPIAKAIRMFR